MTTLNVNLSSQLQSSLGQSGVYAYAVYFDPNDANKTPVWFDLVDNGSIVTSGTVEIPLPSSFKGGKIYFLVQSQDPANPVDLKTAITQESEINYSNATDKDFRYDSFEITLSESPDDVGNLTSVNGFGLPMELSVTYSDGTTDTRGYKISGGDLFTDFANDGNTPLTYTNGPLANEDRSAISPSEAVAQVPPNPTFAASDWTKYIESLQVADPGIEIAAFFNGSADANGVYHNAGFYSYALEWDEDEQVFWLNPAANSEIQGHVKIEPDQLANSIYSTLGDVALYTNKDDTEPYRIFKDTDFATGEFSMNTGENNQWGALLANFLTGFTAGFYGTSGQSLNPLVATPIDLNDNWNWDPTYAFSKNLTAPPDPDSHFQDAYSEVLFFNSNSYGSGYSDNLMRQYAEGGPLIAVSNPQTAPDPGQNVGEIDITLFDDGEVPSGYVTPVIYNYIPPSTGGEYVAIDQSVSTANNVKLNFANANMVLSEEDFSMSLDMITGWSDGEPVWQNIPMEAPAGVSPWQVWTLTYNPDGTWSADLNDGTSQGAGQVLISNFATEEAGTYWYRLNVGDEANQKTFNLYFETSGSSPSPFKNPLYEEQQGSLAIDGQANIVGPNPPPGMSPPETISTFTVNFLYGATNTLDPDLLERDPSKMAGDHPPFAPVAGTWTPENLAGSPIPVAIPVFHALPGQVNPDTNTITTSEAQIAYGWTALNDGTDATKDWIKDYTNKIGALNTALVDISENGQTILSLSATADIDGQWVTASHALSNGTYVVTMSEYLASDTGHTIPLGSQSSELNLSVDIAELDLTSVGAGSPLQAASAVAAGSQSDLSGLALVSVGPTDPPGNWIELQVLESSPDSDGAVVVLYATNEQGERVSRDGLEVGAGVTLDEATLATIGSLRDDAGRLLSHGEQSVYLGTGLVLRFALLKGDEAIDLDPEVSIASLADGSQEVTVGGYVLGAQTENDLSDDATLAAAQRLLGQEFVYLEQGATLDVEIFGSSDNTNELGFVRMDLDPESGEWSVAGVAYGDTEMFRSAVEANLDGGFLASSGGEFGDSMSWTVEGDDGYYAPVLLTQSGEVFVVGYGNADGKEYLRTFGQNTFGFEELTEAQGADFDHNDMVVRLSPAGPTPIEGGGAAETLVGTAAADEIFGFGGDDTLFGRGGDDEIEGGAGDDEAWGQGGDDTILGGSGEDLLRGGDGADELRGGSDDDEIRGASGSDLILGGSGDDLLLGGGGKDELFGESGHDEILAGGGNDFADGGSGNDTIRGGGGRDVILGGSGRDLIDGGIGNDTLTGGSRGDVFVFLAGDGLDIVTDFETGRDLVDLTGNASIGNPGDIGQSSNAVGAVALLAGDSITFAGLTWGEDLFLSDFAV